MTDYLVDGSDLTSVANAIRTKGGTSASLEFPQDFIDAIDAITTGGNYQAKTNISPTESSQTITPDTGSGYDALSSVQINAISSSYVGSAIDRRDSSDLSASGATVTAPAGYYASAATKSVSSMTLPTSAAASATSGYSSKATISRSTSDQYINIPTGYNSAGAYYKVNAVANGTEGTPTATKGTVSNHSVSVTPSVTNTTGYITGSTKTGTAVTVSASELVSGSETKTANGTYDVTNLAQLIVNVSGSGLEYETGTYTPASNPTQPTINFSKSHSSYPRFICMVDTGTSAASSNSVISWNIDIFNATVYPLYARTNITFKTSSSTSGATATITALTGGTSTSMDYYFPSSSIDKFAPYSSASNRYFRQGRSYKWIAVWAPTT